MEFTIKTNVLYEIFKPVSIDPNKEKELYNGMA